MWHGDIRLGDTIDLKFTTRQFSSGAPFTLAGTPSVAAYPSNSTTEITAGITLTVDFDARTGLNNIRVVATSGNGYLTATNYTLVVTAGTVDGVSVVGECVGSFSIEARSALMPTVAARTLAVSAGGAADADAVAISADTVAADRLETMLDGTGGNTLSLGQLNVVNSTGTAIIASSTGGGGEGITATGNGAGAGMRVTGGATGKGLHTQGGVTSGDGLYSEALASGSGIIARAAGTGDGILAQGPGAVSSGTSSGFRADATVNGHGLFLQGSGTGHGIFAQGTSGIRAEGSSGGAGIAALGGATGHGIQALGGVTSGDGINTAAVGSGDGIEGVAVGAGNFGLKASLATDMINAVALAADAVAEIQAGLATAAALATVQADTDDIQAKIGVPVVTLAADIAVIDDFVDTEVAAILAAVDTEVAAIKLKTDNLPEGIQKNAILNNFEFEMVDSADHVTPKTGLAVTAERSIDGGAYAACANAVVEVSAGTYKINLAATDTNGDFITLKFTGAGADATKISFKTES